MRPTELKHQLRTIRTLILSDAKQIELELAEDLSGGIIGWSSLLPEGLGEDQEVRDSAPIVVAQLVLGGVYDERKQENHKFDDLVPQGWLKQYLRYTRDQEAPAIFHLFSALTALGALTCRRVYFDKGYYKVHTSMATVLVAPSGVCTKSTATNIAIRLIREIAPSMLLSSKLTAEALIAALAGRDVAVALVHAPELSVFIGKQRYLEGLIQILTDLLDCPDSWSSETIMRGQNPLYNVGLSLLGASTPDWLVTAIPKDAFGGGFMSRLLIVPCMIAERENALPERPAEKEYLLLLHELGVLANAKGVMRLTPAAKTFYIDWYHEHRTKTATVEEKFAGYQKRKPDHILRVAMLLHLSRHAFMQLDIVSLERAMAIINYIERLLPEVFQRIALSGVGEDHVRLLQIIKREGKIDHSEALRKMYNMTSKQFRASIETLKEQGLVVEIDTSVEHTYYPVAEIDE